LNNFHQTFTLFQIFAWFSLNIPTVVPATQIINATTEAQRDSQREADLWYEDVISDKKTGA